MAGHNDPRLLYSIPNIRAHHIQNGEESPLTPSGPQTLSLLMVPTSSPFADLSTTDPQSAAPEEDFYLHLHLPPELDLPLPATTQIYHQPPSSYLIPRWDLGPDSGAFTRIEFPSIGKGPGQCSQEDVDTFETILAQCTAFLERAQPPPVGGGGYPREKGGIGKGAYPARYNPANYGPGEGYAAYGGGKGGEGAAAEPASGGHAHGHIVLIDEENGSVVGELSEGFHVVEDPNLRPGSKNPVEIQLPQDSTSNQINIRPASPNSLECISYTRHPAYASSSLVSTAATASRFIVTTSTAVSSALQSSAQSFTQKTKPAARPMTFTPTTHARVRKLNNFTYGAATLSAKTVGQVTKLAQNLGATVAGRTQPRGPRAAGQVDKEGKPVEGYRPGILNKSLIAFSTIADGIDQASRNLLTSGSAAATTVVGHKWGPEAGEVARGLSGGVKNVGLVYVDATGVSRRAVIKSVAKGMVVGRVRGGGELVVNPENPDAAEWGNEKKQGELGVPAASGALGGGGRTPSPGPRGEEVVGFGNAAPPPAYGTPGVGEPLHGQPAGGYFGDAKR